MADNWLDQISWNDDGLVPAIAQDTESGEILMMAWMNREALALSREHNRTVTGRAHDRNSGLKVKNRVTFRP